jgi:uncharacterized DUF497 family protein
MMTWDDTKRQANIRKHGLDFKACDTLFDYPVLVEEDTREAYGEQRLTVIGFLDGQVVHMTYTEIPDGLNVISLRRASKHEVKRLQQAVSHH